MLEIEKDSMARCYQRCLVSGQGVIFLLFERPTGEDMRFEHVERTGSALGGGIHRQIDGMRSM